MKWVGIGCAGLLVLFVTLAIIGAALSPDTDTTVTEEAGEPTAVQSAKAKPKATQEWVKISSWSGTTAKNTEPFTVGKNWDIRWNVQQTNPHASSFNIMVYKPGSDLPEELVVNTMGDTQDSSRQYKAGQYYLAIDGLFINYTVEVWELK